jgi:hypothetical protein
LRLRGSLEVIFLYLVRFFRMALIATASSGVLIFTRRILDLTDRPFFNSESQVLGAAFADLPTIPHSFHGAV